MKIGKREKKAFIIGGVAIFIILSYLLLDGLIGYREDLLLKKDAERLKLSHLIGKITYRGETEKRATEAKTELGEAEKGLIPGDKPAVGAAELQKVLKDMASSTGIEIKSERIINPVEMDTYSIISVEITFISTVAKLRDLLYSIETSPFILSIPDMKIRVMNIMNPTDIHVNLTVRGLIKKSTVGEKKEGSA